MKISDLAKRSGISAHTLRFYEKSGLLKPSSRNANNYRVYSEDDLSSAKFIQHCKQCGFTLAEITALLVIRHDKSQHICAEAKMITVNKLNEISAQIEQLKKMQQTLLKLEEFCCGGQESAEFCSIISSLEGDK